MAPRNAGGQRIVLPPHNAETVSSGGWIDLQGIASKLRLSGARVTKEWEPLGAALK